MKNVKSFKKAEPRIKFVFVVIFNKLLFSYFRLMKDFPNSYAFTKNLSEGLVVEQINKGMPCMILRPSIGNLIII